MTVLTAHRVHGPLDELSSLVSGAFLPQPRFRLRDLRRKHHFPCATVRYRDARLHAW